MKIKISVFGPFNRLLEAQEIRKNADLFTLKFNTQSRFDPVSKVINLSREADLFTLDHELGHAIMNELVFGKSFIVPKLPHYKNAIEYAWITNIEEKGVENPGEGWAQAFCDYFNRPDYLREKSPVLHSFCRDVIRLNPEILNIRRDLHNQFTKEKETTKNVREVFKKLAQYKQEADSLKADHWASENWKEYLEHIKPEWEEYCSTHRKEIALVMFDYMYNEGLSREQTIHKVDDGGACPMFAGDLSYRVRTVLHDIDTKQGTSGYRMMVSELKRMDLTVEEVKEYIRYTGWRSCG